MKPSNFFKRRPGEPAFKKRFKTTEQEEIETSPDKIKSLDGKKVVISGVLRSITRESLEELIQKHRGKVTTSVCKSTNMLVVGGLLEDNRPVEDGRKYQNAKKFGVSIINELEFQEFMQKLLKDPGFLLGDGSLGKSLCDLKNTGKVEQKKADSTESDEVNEPTQPEAPVRSKKPRDPPKNIIKSPKEFFKGREYKEEQETQPSPKKQEIDQSNIDMQRDTDCKNWVDKYAPKSSRDLIGNSANINCFRNWLSDWDDVILNGNKKEIRPQKGRGWNNLPKLNARA